VAATAWGPVTVFSTVATTILLFAVGFPMMLRRLRAETPEPAPPPPAHAGTTPEP
jgi:hypothetical protein